MDRIVAGVTLERVVPGAAQQDVDACVACENVRAAAAGQVLEAGSRVRPGAARRLGRSECEAQGDATRDARVVQGVDVGAAIEDVVAGAVENRVVAIVAEHDIVSGSTGEPVSGGSTSSGCRRRRRRRGCRCRGRP